LKLILAFIRKVRELAECCSYNLEPQGSKYFNKIYSPIIKHSHQMKRIIYWFKN
jgi:hypothetical protein